MEIIKYRKSNDIDVLFEDGFIVENVRYIHFKNGNIKNLFYPNIYNIGYVGKGKYKSRENCIKTLVYTIWFNMLTRCYSEEYQREHPSYIGCSVCKEWHNFQIFAEWYNNNVWDEKFTTLDKDILFKGNKEYSPNTCCLVDHRINTLFVKSDGIRGNLPVGVCKHNNKFIPQIKYGNNKNKQLGSYSTTDEAFLVYKKAKESYIKQIAEEYKEKYLKFPDKLYKAMMKYEVDIDD